MVSGGEVQGGQMVMIGARGVFGRMGSGVDRGVSVERRIIPPEDSPCKNNSSSRADLENLKIGVGAIPAAARPPKSASVQSSRRMLKGILPGTKIPSLSNNSVRKDKMPLAPSYVNIVEPVPNQRRPVMIITSMGGMGRREQVGQSDVRGNSWKSMLVFIEQRVPTLTDDQIRMIRAHLRAIIATAGRPSQILSAPAQERAEVYALLSEVTLLSLDFASYAGGPPQELARAFAEFEAYTSRNITKIAALSTNPRLPTAGGARSTSSDEHPGRALLKRSSVSLPSLDTQKTSLSPVPPSAAGVGGLGLDGVGIRGDQPAAHRRPMSGLRSNRLARSSSAGNLEPLREFAGAKHGNAIARTSSDPNTPTCTRTAVGQSEAALQQAYFGSTETQSQTKMTSGSTDWWDECDFDFISLLPPSPVRGS